MCIGCGPCRWMREFVAVFLGAKIVFHFFNYKILYTQQLYCACAVLSLVVLSKLCAVCILLCSGISAVE